MGQDGGTRDKSCVIVVGSTGTGKSSTIAKCTGCNVITGQGHQSVTKFCDAYEPLANDLRNDLVWIDTPGWDDMDGDDVDTFQSILQLVNRHNLTSVKAIIWTIHPASIRQDATIDKQARLINQFADKAIWNNVIIVCKHALNAEHEATGAMKAAYYYNPLSKMQITGYRFLNDCTLNADQRELFANNPAVRHQLNILSDKEVKNLILECISRLTTNIQIIFNHYKCQNCGVEGDRRLLPQYCHMEKHSIHPEQLIWRHPKGTRLYHPADGHVKDHPGDIVLAGCFRKEPKYDCCKKASGFKGCKDVWACCRQPLHDKGCKTKYLCCGQNSEISQKGCETVFKCCDNNEASPGCQDVCKKCGCQWGNATKGCFKTNHHLMEMEYEL